MRRAALGSLLALMLTGCAVGPNYRLPEKAVVNLPAARGALADSGALTTAGEVPQRWWHLYDDPVLDRLEEQALAANTDLRMAAANLARARAITQGTEGAGEPELAVEAAAQHARLSGESFLLPESLPVANLGSAGVEMSYQLDLFGRIRRATEAARADEQADEALVGAVKVTLAAEVARAYLGVCGAQEAGDIATEAAGVADNLAEVARRLQSAGRGSAIEVSIADQRAAEMRALLPQERAKARAALYRLSFLLGRPPADYPRDAQACRHLPALSRALPVGDGAALLARRPDVRAAERQLAAATARIGVATADLYPQVGFGLSAGSSGFLSDLGNAAANRWGFGSLIRWSFPGAGARARVRAANAESEGALARFDGKVLAALREAETAIANYQENHNRAAALGDASAAAERNAAQIRRLRQAGRAAVQLDLGGRGALFAARLREQASREAVVQDQITLFQALGGGW